MVDSSSVAATSTSPTTRCTGRSPSRAAGANRATRGNAVWGPLRDAVDRQASAAGRVQLDILDAGGGTGGLAVPLAELGHRVTVVDRSPNALAALDRRAAEAGVTSHIVGRQGDVDGVLAVAPAGSADVVLCHGVLETVDDPRTALVGLVACLRPGGLLSVLAANRHALVLARALGGHVASARHALADPEGRWGDDDPAPRRFAEADLLDLLTAAGLQIATVHGVRIFTDLVPGPAGDLEGGVDALLELEAAASEHPAFREIAAQLHVLATLDVAGDPPRTSPAGESRSR